MKKTLVGLLFLVGILVAAALLRKTAREDVATAIEEVLRLDRQFHAESQAYVEQGTPQLDAWRWYAGQMRRIDTRGCPADFREAFYLHMRAWEAVPGKVTAAAEVEERASAAASRGALLDLLRMAAGDYTVFLNMLEDQDILPSPELAAANAAWQHVDDTWTEVERLAVRHGADIRR